MNLGSDIRENLPECGDCINCKLIIWSNEADKKELRSQSSIDLSDDNRYYFTVRCNWLKTVIQEPLYLQKCEGKKRQGSSN
ncbi:hypothetical protein [Psychrobacter sp. NPDC078761]|jgi:hypothetical protein|uniref:hypothetical protein n=1 Tax=Psychrobacter sp. NPDC078761 TaxID=3390668 RepID=UPI003CFED389|tara:strand:+ start:3215 stop:3457 length:243 start_codon:yes stop_codon:yes gene_type:complete